MSTNSNVTSTSGRIKHIQKYLKLEPDGIIGPAILTAVENRLFDKADESENDYSLTISSVVMKQLVQHEIVSRSYCNRYLKHPIWPGGASGVTIGIGYDPGYNRSAQIRRDWQGKVSDADLGKTEKSIWTESGQSKATTSSFKSCYGHF